MKLIALLLLCSCDKIITFEKNPGPDAPEPDALNPCTKPAFNSYTFSQRGNWGASANQELHPTMDANNVYFQLLGGGLYSAPIDSTTVANGIAEEPSFTRFHPSLTADRASLLFQRRATPSYNIVDVRKWTLGTDIATAVPLTFLVGGAPTIVEPGSTAMFRGKHRMVGWTIPMANNLQLVELESADGITWNDVQPSTLPWRLPVGRELDTSLSPDGCTLLFVSSRANTLDVFFSWRLDDGSFANPERLAASDATKFQRGPTLGLDGRLWFFNGTTFNQDNQALWVGVPP